jgi:hypothetical protein
MTKFNSSMMSHYLSLKPEVVVCQILKFLMFKNSPLKFERFRQKFIILMTLFTYKCEQKYRTKLQREKQKKKIWGIFTG